MSNLQPNCCLKIDFQKMDQHAGGKWLIHDTKRRKDNQLQSLKLQVDTPNVIDKHKSKRGPSYRRRVFHPRPQTPQRESVAMTGILLLTTLGLIKNLI